MSSVSVIVPTYNYARYLPGCVRSVLTQSDVDVEILIIDDCSSDDTEEIGTELAAADARVTFRRHAVNQGHIATYNEGIDWASGDYLALLSADDLLTAGALGRATSALDSQSTAGLVYGRSVFFVTDDEIPPADRRTTAVSLVRSGLGGRPLQDSDELHFVSRGRGPYVAAAEARGLPRRPSAGWRPGNVAALCRARRHHLPAPGRPGLLSPSFAEHDADDCQFHDRRFCATTAALDLLFSQYGALLRDAERLDNQAKEALAREALLGRRSSLRSTALSTRRRSRSSSSSRSKTYPSATRLPEFRGLSWRRRLGPRRCRVVLAPPAKQLPAQGWYRPVVAPLARVRGVTRSKLPE